MTVLVSGRALRPRLLDQPLSSWRVQLALLGVIFLAVLASRAATFFISQIGVDESLYFLIAEQWRAGHLPYTTIWDNKPLGIYAILAVFQSIFGDSVFSIRIAAVISVAVTAFAVANITLRFPHPNRRLRTIAGIAAALCYVVCSLSNGGLESNTEIFMVCFTALAVLSAVSSDFYAGAPFTQGIVTGLLFGLAIMTKYVAVFEAPALAFALLAVAGGRSAHAVYPIVLGAAVGAALPIMAPIMLYTYFGQFDLWYQHSIVANLRREQAGMQIGVLLLHRLAEWLPLWCTAIVLAASLLSQWRKPFGRPDGIPPRRLHVFLVVWVVGGIFGVCSAKGFYSHFFIQVLPPLCVTTGWVILYVVPGAATWSRKRTGLFAAVFLSVPVLAAGATFFQASKPILSLDGHRIAFHSDTADLIARDLMDATSGRPATFYDFDYNIMVYSLTGMRLPTRYVFPLFLNNCFLAFVAGVDAPQEEARILAEDPEFILRSEPPSPSLPPLEDSVYRQLEEAVSTRYVVDRRYDGAVLYRRRTDSVRPAPDPQVWPSSCPMPRAP